MSQEQFRNYQEQSFDAFCKKVIRNEAINIHKRFAALAEKEVSRSSLSHSELSAFYYEDTYHPYQKTYYIQGSSICIYDPDLGVVLQFLSSQRRDVILLCFFLKHCEKIICPKLRHISRQKEFWYCVPTWDTFYYLGRFFHVENVVCGFWTFRRRLDFSALRMGSKSQTPGWDNRWGQLREVTSQGSPTTGAYRPYGLDCSGFLDWVFYNTSGGKYVLSHGGGAAAQHSYCEPIPWGAAQPGDLVFYPNDDYVGIVGLRDSTGNLLIIHCASGQNNVVITDSSGFMTVGRPLYYSES